MELSFHCPLFSNLLFQIRHQWSLSYGQCLFKYAYIVLYLFVNHTFFNFRSFFSLKYLIRWKWVDGNSFFVSSYEYLFSLSTLKRLLTVCWLLIVLSGSLYCQSNWIFLLFFVGKLSSLLGLSLSLLILPKMHYAFTIWTFECIINSGKFSITISLYIASRKSILYWILRE